MKNVKIRVLNFALAVAIMPAALSAQTAQQLASLGQIQQADPTVKVRWNRQTGTPARLAGQLSAPLSGDARAICEQFFSANQTIFGVSDVQQQLSFIASNTDARGWEHARLQQMHNALPVDGNNMLVHIDANRQVQVVTGRYLPNIEVDTEATVSAEDAIAAAQTHLNPQVPINQTPGSELCVYHFNGNNHLAWKVRIFSDDPLGDFIYYIDAKSGEVIDQYNNLKFTMQRKTYDARNGTSLPGLLVRNEGEAAYGDAVLDAAHDNAGIVYQYYQSNFGRDSYDNRGATIISTAHYSNRYNNAFWNSFQMVYGDGDGEILGPLSLALDVVAHELTHAVTERESNLVYRDQPGALNESISDIFAALVDDEDWQIGEDVWTPNEPGDALRDMFDPTKGNQPAHMDEFVDTDQDNGGVHINSGIPNKAAQLMADGGTFRGVTVPGIGREAMGKIFYEAQINWLHTYSDFADARDATLDAVAVVFPNDAGKAEAVAKAWDAVGLKAPSPITLSIDPASFRVNPDGGTEQISVVVRNNGAAMNGATVTFVSSNTSLATVSPASATTGANGKVTATVTGANEGNAVITISTTDGVNSASGTVEVEVANMRVPVMSPFGMVVFILLLGLVLVVVLKNALRPGSAR